MKNGTDYFDISLIAGVSISLQVSPDATQSTGASMPSSPYTCASLGRITPTIDVLLTSYLFIYIIGNPQASASGLGPSSWSFSPPPNFDSTDYKWVTPSSTPPVRLRCVKFPP
jgi:hypothetical protein